MTDPRSISADDLVTQINNGLGGEVTIDLAGLVAVLRNLFVNGDCDYASHAALVAASVPPDKLFVSIATPAGKLLLQRDATGTAATSADGAKWAPFGEPYPHHFGALGDNTNDDTDALNAWMVYLRQSELMGRLPAANYRTTDTLVMTGGDLQTRWGFTGDGKRATRIRADFSDGSKNVMELLQQKSNLQISGFSIQPHDNQDGATISPVALKFDKLGNSWLSDIGFYQIKNSVLRTARLANLRAQDIEIWGCGLDFSFKDTTGIYFTLSGTTLTADADIFEAEDVGKTFVLNSAGYYDSGAVIGALSGDPVFMKYKITALTDAQTVTVTGDYFEDVAGASGYFGAPRIASGSGTTLVADRPCFAAEHVGVRFWVANPAAEDKVEIVTIASVTDSYTIEVDSAVTGVITDQEFAVCVVDISDPDLDTSGNDYLFRNMHIEHYSGVALGVRRHTLGRFSECKLHGEVYSNEGVSIAHQWHSWSGADWEGSCFMDRSAVGDGQVRFFDQKGQDFHFDRLISTYILNQTILKLGAFETVNGYLGHVSVGSAYFRSNYDKAKMLSHLVEDANTPKRLDFMGTITTQMGEEAPAATLPEQVQFGLDGALFSYEEGSFTASFSDDSNNTKEITSKTIFWRKVGGQVTIYFNFTNDIDLSSLISTDTLRINLPFSVAAHAFAQALFTGGPIGSYVMWAGLGNSYAVFKDPADLGNMTVSEFTSGAVDLIGCTLTYATSD